MIVSFSENLRLPTVSPTLFWKYFCHFLIADGVRADAIIISLASSVIAPFLQRLNPVRRLQAVPTLCAIIVNFDWMFFFIEFNSNHTFFEIVMDFFVWLPRIISSPIRFWERVACMRAYADLSFLWKPIFKISFRIVLCDTINFDLATFIYEIVNYWNFVHPRCDTATRKSRSPFIHPEISHPTMLFQVGEWATSSRYYDNIYAMTT